MIIIKPTLCTLTREFHCYFAKPLLLLFLTPRPALSSHQHGTLVCLFWSGNLYCTVLTHQGITWLLAKSAFSCWMYPTAQIILSLTPRHPWVPQSDHTVNKLSGDAGSLWNSVKQSSRPQVILKTQPPICLYYVQGPPTTDLIYNLKLSYYSRVPNKTVGHPV